MKICALERSNDPLQGLSFWEHNLPWAHPRILHGISKSKWLAGADERSAGHGVGTVYSRAANNASIRGMRDNDTAARAVGNRHGSGRGGKPDELTAVRRQEKRIATGRAGGTGNA